MGSFVMGAPDDEFRRNLVIDENGSRLATPEDPFVKEDEGPQHEVTVDIRIAMGRNEITFDEWMACVNDGGCGGYVPESDIRFMGPEELVLGELYHERLVPLPSSKRIVEEMMLGSKVFPLRGRYPVFLVSYLDAQSYVAWLNDKLGTDAYRLPTEAEWEYGARAGTTTRFAQGFEVTSEQANFCGSATAFMLGEERPDLRCLNYPVPVDELDAANPWGLRHMSGNIGEVTLSCYTERYEGWATTSEWLEKSFGESCKRTQRGGGYISPMDVTRVAWRAPKNETYQTSFVGFRIVKELTAD